MADRALEFISFEGTRTSRAAPCPAHLDSDAHSRAERPVRSAPGPDLAWLTLSGCGVDPDAYRARPLARRVSACLRALGVRSEADARALVETHADARLRALASFLIPVTAFFRDAAVFDEVQRIVIPSLAARRGRLRAWSAGCSNGSELYSLAILLAEAGLLARSDLVGTDCRPEALEQAHAAVFAECAVQGLAADRLAACFDRLSSGRWRAAERLRRYAEWRLRDITRHVEPGPWDVVLWRNVAIYLRPEAAQTIARGLVAALAPRGFLVVGKAERLPAGLGVRRVGRSLYQQMESAHVP